MRKTLMTAALVALLAVPALGQRPGMGMGTMTAEQLLANKSVQAELKLTDKQKGEMKKAQDAMQASMKKAFEDKDFSELKTIREDFTKAVKKVKEGLSKDQAKRLSQIELQQAGLDAFDKKEVQTALKLTDKQKDAIKGAKKDLQADVKELRDDAGRDFKKLFAVAEKARALHAKATDKIMKSLNADQKKEWEKLVGKKFELKMEFPGFGRPDKDKEDK